MATARENFARALQFLASKYGAKSRLAEACKVSPTSAARWVKGLQQPTFEQIDAIAKFYKVPVAFFFEDVADNSTLQYEAAYRRLGELLPKSKKS